MKQLGPFLPLYVDDMLGGTIHFGADEVGAYLLLLMHQWSAGAIENNPNLIERVSRCSYDRLGRVLAKFDVRDGHLVNRRLEAVRAERMAFVASRVDNAKAGWEKRKQENAIASASASAPSVHSGGNPSPSPSPSPVYNDVVVEVEDGDASADASASDVAKMIKAFRGIRPEFMRVREVDIANALKNGPKEVWATALSEFERDQAGALEVPATPYKLFAGYIRRLASEGTSTSATKRKSRLQ